uniref:RAS guanyl-releasing protein 3 n=1 Tax=Rhipicephalus appendiculatus TaxID=34631 RepID=A0A131YAR9_RHIAP
MLDRPSEVYPDHSFKKRRLEDTSCAQRLPDLEQNQVSDVSSSSRSSQQQQQQQPRRFKQSRSESESAPLVHRTSDTRWKSEDGRSTATHSYGQTVRNT